MNRCDLVFFTAASTANSVPRSSALARSSTYPRAPSELGDYEASTQRGTAAAQLRGGCCGWRVELASAGQLLERWTIALY